MSNSFAASERLSFMHYENMPIKNFSSKTENFQIKISDIFHISAKKINCGYSLEPTIYVFEQK